MDHKQIERIVLLVLLQMLSSFAFAATYDDPCGGPAALLNIADRPSAGDSACVVPYKKVVMEFGYQYQELTHSAGHQQNFPEAVFRLGLPADNEFVVVLPNRILQSDVPRAGSTATIVGLKHELGYNQFWLAAIESLVALPNGSAAFGSKGTGLAINGILSYAFNDRYNATFMLGGSTATTPSMDGGKRYSSVNPDLVLTYSATEFINVYGEIYGQTKTAPDETSGYNFDGGLLYLVSPHAMVDIEVGHRVSGNLAGFHQYVGTGFAIMF